MDKKRFFQTLKEKQNNQRKIQKNKKINIIYLKHIKLSIIVYACYYYLNIFIFKKKLSKGVFKKDDKIIFKHHT